MTQDSPGVRPGEEWLRGSRAVVFGLGRSGEAAAELLVSRGARVVGVDESARELLAGPWARQHLHVASDRADPSLLEGVELFVLSPGIPLSHPFVRAAAERGVPVVSEIELAWRCSATPVVAVTGSKGKSTTTALIGALLQSQGRDCIVCGNIGLPYSAVVDRVGPAGWIVLELSSFQLESVESFHARVAVLLQISPDHLDRYPSYDAYAEAKLRIGRHQSIDDVLVVDPQDPYGARLAKRSAAQVTGFGTTWEGRGVVREGDSLVWVSAGEREALACVQDVPLLGQHNLRNAMAALAAARSVTSLDERARQALRNFQALSFRMQPAGEIAGIRFVNDSKGTTPDAVLAGLEGLGGTVVLVLGGRNKDLDFRGLRPHLGSVRAVLIYGESAPEIERALSGAARLERVRDLDEVVARTLEIGRPGDLCLFSPGCTSFDMFRNAEHRGEEFDAAVGRARARHEAASTRSEG